MEENNSLMPQKANEEQLFAQIKQMLDNARKQIAHAVNSTTIEAYWQVGKYIVEYEQSGKARAEYGKGVITSLSKRLMAEYGGGFTITNLKIMRLFYLSYPKEGVSKPAHPLFISDIVRQFVYATIFRIGDSKSSQFIP